LSIGIEPIQWLSDPTIAFISVLLVEVWQMTPYSVLFLSAGIQALPKSPFEAAKIDGANAIQSFFNIMLPLLRPVLLVIILFRTIHLFKIFDIIFILTGGGPADVTNVLSVYINLHAFSYFDMGYASAVSMIMVSLLVIFSLMANRFMRRES
jgi:multiple sugar transport system permease protein